MEEEDVNIDIIFKIAAVGILIAVLNQVLLRAGREEMAMLTTLAGVVVVLLMVVNLINNLFNSIKSIFRLY
jgi:stage III sporulation protein AC